MPNGVHCLDYSVGAGYCVPNTGPLWGVMSKNETERTFVLVMLMCEFALLWMMVKDAVVVG